MQQQDAVDRRARIAHDNSVGEWSEGGSHTLLIAGLHSEQGRDGADNTDGFAGLEKGPGPVTTREGDAQRLEPGRECGTLNE